MQYAIEAATKAEWVEIYRAYRRTKNPKYHSYNEYVRLLDMAHPGGEAGAELFNGYIGLCERAHDKTQPTPAIEQLACKLYNKRRQEFYNNFDWDNPANWSKSE